MIILLYAAIVLAAITIIGNLMLHKWNAKRLDQRVGERVDAYLTSLEREGVPEPLDAMGSDERREMLIAAARQVKAESDRRFYIAAIGGIVAFFVALGFAIEGAGTRDFVITLAIGAAVIYGVNTVLYRNLRSKLAARGIELERIATQ
ncbi:hypothetical protein [Pelagibacterium sediminicola]|uniref:hypothetical protein n=1 Tax=Pelagibacterium sediminicola TaxID=2248761 RepID=UPI000E31BCD5|nr:hypothetical protein [Pelagibacterium sediminicola]